MTPKKEVELMNQVKMLETLTKLLEPVLPNPNKESYIGCEEAMELLGVNESYPDAVPVNIDGTHMFIDNHNLINGHLCSFYYDGVYGKEQYFNWPKAYDAATTPAFDSLTCRKVENISPESRLLRETEMQFIAQLPHRWDSKKHGMWFTFEHTYKKSLVEVFFPAYGKYIGRDGIGFLKSGEYWCYSSLNRPCSMKFTKDQVSVGGSNSHCCSVRCVHPNIDYNIKKLDESIRNLRCNGASDVLERKIK
jgi:hypothetical protein